MHQLWLVDPAHKLDGVPKGGEGGQVVILAAGIHWH